MAAGIKLVQQLAESGSRDGLWNDGWTDRWLEGWFCLP